MTQILQVIAEQGLDSFEKIKSHFSTAPFHIKVVEDVENNLYLMKYDQIKTDFSHPASLEARGIIFEKGTNRIVCFPFCKFFNDGEKYAAKIDWQTASVQHKYDGSIIKLYWLESKSKWMVATNGTTDARKATVGINEEKNFYTLFQDTLQSSKLDFSILNKECTYMFELLHPEQTIVVRYPEPKLIHIGTRNVKTLQESYESIGVEQVETFALQSLADCHRAASSLGPSREGFVVCDGSWNRVKIKGKVYLLLHHFIIGADFTEKELAVRLLLNGEWKEIEAYSQEPRLEEIGKMIQDTQTSAQRLAQKLCKIWQETMKKKPKNRKDIVIEFKKQENKYF